MLIALSLASMAMNGTVIRSPLMRSLSMTSTTRSFSKGRTWQAHGAGRKGLPLLVDPAPPTDDELAAMLRGQRNAALDATDWLVSRHQDESLFAAATTLTKDQAAALGAYRKELRDLPGARLP